MGRAASHVSSTRRHSTRNSVAAAGSDCALRKASSCVSRHRCTVGGSARPARSAVARSRAEPVAAVAARASVAERARLTKALVMKA